MSDFFMLPHTFTSHHILPVENFWRVLSCDIKNKCSDRPMWVPVYKQNETKTQKPRSTFQSTDAMAVGVYNCYIKASYGHER